MWSLDSRAPKCTPSSEASGCCAPLVYVLRASHVGEMIRANALFVLAMASVLSCAHANLHRAARDNDAGFFTDDLSPEALNQREPGSGQTPLSYGGGCAPLF